MKLSIFLLTNKGRLIMFKILLVLLFIPLSILPQHNDQENVWEPLKYFVGSWEGQGTGKWGISKAEKVNEFIMNGKYLFTKHKSVYKPQEKNPTGEVFEQWAFYSYDKNRGKFIFRAFNIEGFVSQYLLDSLSTDGTTFVFVTESSENLPDGFRARLTYSIINDDEYKETFELGFPGKELEIYLENSWKRKK